MSNFITATSAARAYLVAELSRLFEAGEIQHELVRGVDYLSEKELWRLLEALSFTYRLNSMFWFLSDGSFSWHEEEVDCAKLTLTGMSPEIDAVTYSAAIQNDPLKFRDYLAVYFEEHPTDDPQGLEQFRPSGRGIRYPTIFLEEKEDGTLCLRDGSNRLIATLLQGKTRINAIIGSRTKCGKPRIGDSLFWLLRQRYERAGKEEREAILLLVKNLMRDSLDGRDAVEEYWVKHAMDEKIKAVGKLLLASFGA